MHSGIRRIFAAVWQVDEEFIGGQCPDNHLSILPGQCDDVLSARLRADATEQAINQLVSLQNAITMGIRKPVRISNSNHRRVTDTVHPDITRHVGPILALAHLQAGYRSQ
jgi:hypothetical protein